MVRMLSIGYNAMHRIIILPHIYFTLPHYLLLFSLQINKITTRIHLNVSQLLLFNNECILEYYNVKAVVGLIERRTFVANALVRLYLSLNPHVKHLGSAHTSEVSLLDPTVRVGYEIDES